MIIDIHVHICPPEIRQNRTPYLDGEPEFAAIYKDPRAKLLGASELVSAMDEQGVDKSVVFGFPWRKKENFLLNNNYVLEAAKRFPDRLIPFCCMFPEHPETKNEIERCLAQGVRGIGELAFYANGLDKQALNLLQTPAELARKADCPLLLHTNEPIGHIYPGKSPMNLAQIYELIKSYPETKWIFAHLGGGLPFFGFMKKEVREVLKNCWFDTAAMPFLYKPDVLRVMSEAIGSEKLLFGTDFPLLPPKRYYKELEQSSLTEEEKQNILGRNAHDFLYNKL